MNFLYEESRRTGLPTYTNDFSTPYKYFDSEEFIKELKALGEELKET